MIEFVIKTKGVSKTVRETYLEDQHSDTESDKNLYWFDDCHEINLWAYWQGRNNLNAKILLVGQDWGNPWDMTCDAFMQKLDCVGAGAMDNYMENNESTTDQNLTDLFRESLGIDVSKPCSDVFFTNYVMGYRKGKISGGFRKAWVQHDQVFFKELVEIIEPKVILGLGRNVFEAVLMSFQQRPSPRIRRYNDYIESSNNPQTVTLQDEKNIPVFALAHCGAMVTMNRNRGKYLEDKLLLQKEDWRRIVPYLSVKEDVM